MRVLRWVAGVAVTGLLVGCSGGDGAGPVAPTTAVVPGPSAPPTTSVEAVPARLPDDAFYLPSDPLPVGLPGALLRSEERPAPAGARAWSVLYLSQGVAGALVAVSGVVVAPDGPAPTGGRPVLAWAHGTVGSADACAPSRGDDLGVPALPELLAAGFVVAATDYEGLGTPGPHPYLVGTSEARGVLDAARAAAHLPDAGASHRVVVWGHSQGGHAALFAGQEAPTYAPELTVLGVAAAAPAARPSALVATTSESTFLGAFHLLAAAGLAAGRPDLRLDDVLTAAGRSLLPQVEEHCLPRLVLDVLARGEAVGRPPGPGGPWAEVLADNDVGGAPLRVPVRLDQGDADPVVPAVLTRDLAAQLCAAGLAVESIVHPGADHVGALSQGRAEVVAWALDRTGARLHPAPAERRRRTPHLCVGRGR